MSSAEETGEARSGLHPVMSAIRGGGPSPGRLSVEHVEARDRALYAIDVAIRTLSELERIERGDPHAAAISPRYDDVEKLVRELKTLAKRLDEVYV